MTKKDGTQAKYHLRLFIAGRSSATLLAIETLRKPCDHELQGQCELDAIDVIQQPELAERARVIATPTLIKQAPEPQRKVIGSSSNRDRLLLALDIPRTFSE
ncbi:MAG TPA: circadian clock KaiB family protein [Gammaproteobacteria bacterium]|nr:circadian clock KaiB family protein [Gammaproteobacteria bacterium]